MLDERHIEPSRLFHFIWLDAANKMRSFGAQIVDQSSQRYFELSSRCCGTAAAGTARVTCNKKYCLLLKNFVEGNIHSQFSKLCTASGLNTGFSLVPPTKVKSCKFFVFAQKFPIVENKEHMFDFVIHNYFLSLCFNALHINKVSQSTSLRFATKLSSELTPLDGLGKFVTKMVTGCLKMTKVAKFAS